MTRPLMTCRELIEFLDRYVEEALPADQRREFDRHLALCPPCVAFLESYRQVIQLVRAASSAPESAVPEALPEEFVSAVLAALRRQ